MVDQLVFSLRLAKLEELLRHLRQMQGTTFQAFTTNAALQAQAERWLQLAAECVLDLAHHLIAESGFRTPTSYRDAFAVLLERGVLDAELSARMQQWAGFRNVLVHLYLDVDAAIVYEVLQRDLDDLETYASKLIEAVGRLAAES